MRATATFERSSLQAELRKLFRRAKLPTSPGLATQILALAANPDATREQFAEAIALDGALSARLLKMANCAQFAQREPVTSISRAVTVLGIDRVKTAALGFQLVGHLNKLGGCPFDMKVYWQYSLLRGCVARELAKLFAPALTEEAFLVGLLQECGALLLVQLYGAEYAALVEAGRSSPTAFYDEERRKFQYNHVQAIMVMAAEWGLPHAIAIPLAKHHRPTVVTSQSSELDHLCAVACLVGTLSFSGDTGRIPPQMGLEDFSGRLAISSEQLQGVFRAAAENYAASAAMLGEAVPDDLDVTDLLGEANQRLEAVLGEAVSRVDTVEAERANLADALGAYRERAARDPLTGVLNRGALMDAARSCQQAAVERNSTITAMFIDIDNFKKLNDTYGHRVGDEVLRGVAETLRKNLANAGCAGRYGGEEFVLVLPDLDQEAAQGHAQRLVEAVRRTDFSPVGVNYPVTCSLGAVWGHADRIPAIEDLCAMADELMYSAKRGGKDRHVFRALEAGGNQSNESAACCAGSGAACVLSAGGAPSIGAIPSRESQAAEKAVSAAMSEAGVRQHCAGIIPEYFHQIAQRMNREAPKRFVNMRKQQRKELLTPCVLTVFAGTSLQVQGENAYVRNISTGGLGILATRPLVRGEPVEVMICPQGQTMLYVAGPVAFCRHIEGMVYEVGIQSTAHSREPIFSANPAEAVQKHAWLSQALQDRQTSGSPVTYTG
jgi:diguanylate cyclase (GGDEF)-like protein